MARPARNKRKVAGKTRGKKIARATKAGAKRKASSLPKRRVGMASPREHGFFVYFNPGDPVKECQCRLFPPRIEAQEGDTVTWYILGGGEGVLAFTSDAGEPVRFETKERGTKPGKPLKGTVKKKARQGEHEEHRFEVTTGSCPPGAMIDLAGVLIISDPQP